MFSDHSLRRPIFWTPLDFSYELYISYDIGAQGSAEKEETNLMTTLKTLLTTCALLLTATCAAEANEPDRKQPTYRWSCSWVEKFECAVIADTPSAPVQRPKEPAPVQKPEELVPPAQLAFIDTVTGFIEVPYVPPPGSEGIFEREEREAKFEQDKADFTKFLCELRSVVGWIGWAHLDDKDGRVTVYISDAQGRDEGHTDHNNLHRDRGGEPWSYSLRGFVELDTKLYYALGHRAYSQVRFSGGFVLNSDMKLNGINVHLDGTRLPDDDCPLLTTGKTQRLKTRGYHFDFSQIELM
jgi:hypothetical protein